MDQSTPGSYEFYLKKKRSVAVLHAEMQAGDPTGYAARRLGELRASAGAIIPFEDGVFGPELCWWCQGTLIWKGDPEDIAMDDAGIDFSGPCPMCRCTGLEMHATS